MSDLKTQLEDLYARHKKLTPKLVVDEARDPDHPLHHRFEWDDSVAGDRYREIQASVLIRSVRIVNRKGDDGGDEEAEKFAVRAFVSVPLPEGQTYVPTETAREDEFMRRLVLQTAEREWRDLFKRYQHLEEFLGIVRRDLAS